MLNPFVFNAASTLTNEQLKSMFISDHTYSRFIESKRNVFFWGERGCGKTMMLLYNRLQLIDLANKQIASESSVSLIPVYISCITPLISKREHLLLDTKFKATVISEHYLSLTMALSLIESLLELDGISTFLDDDTLSEDFSYVFNDNLPSEGSALKRLKRFIQKKCIETQKEVNRAESDSFYDDTYNFTSIVIPLIEIFKEISCFKDTHFIFMMDDAHDLNEHQKLLLNSWIAYRDNSSFSFKVSAAKTPLYSMITGSGGTILQGHDYVSVDIEQPFQNDDSAYGKLARKIITRRLELIKINKTPEEFFPANQDMESDLEIAKEKARLLALDKFSESNSKAITDYVYKYTRAIYFRERSAKANRPPYSGFETIVSVSSGVIRNLLEPCFVMYDDMLSKVGDPAEIDTISSAVQTDVLLRLSTGHWKRLKDGLDNVIENCTSIDGVYVENLFNCLAELFKSRLMDKTCSEPRAIMFTISARATDIMDRLVPILNIARRAQLLYVRPGPAKDKGEIEEYYVPNKMFWPSRGLDPVGQHARVSIQARYLLDAAINKTPIPSSGVMDSDSSVQQAGLFDE